MRSQTEPCAFAVEGERKAGKARAAKAGRMKRRFLIDFLLLFLLPLPTGETWGRQPFRRRSRQEPCRRENGRSLSVRLSGNSRPSLVDARVAFVATNARKSRARSKTCRPRPISSA